MFSAAASLLSVGTAQADGAPPKRIISGWMPYWMTSPAHPEAVNSAVQNADLMTEVSPFWFSATAKAGGGVQVRFNPNFSNAAANATWAMSQLKAAGLLVLPSIADGSGKGRMAATLADPGLRAAHVADIVALVQSSGYDGIDLDYETFAFSDGSGSWPATQPNWTAFVQQLGAGLHAVGKQLAVTIPPPCSTGGTCGPRSGYWVYNLAGIAPSVDRIRVMAYDYHVNGIGPIAPMPWVRAIVQYSASVMDPSRFQIGVPTYGRAWTRKTPAGSDMTSGVCPAASSAAYKTLTGMTSINGADVPALLASVGVPDAAVQWSAGDQENWVNYDKKLQWTDSSGTPQTCIAKRVLWFVGPQAVLARTQLVGEFGLSAAAYWTIGGENPGQWPLLRAYGQSLAPAGTDIAVVGVPAGVFGVPITFTAIVTSAGVPVTGVNAVLRFRAEGSKNFVDVQSQPLAGDGSVAFTVAPSGTGQFAVFVPGAVGRAEALSAPFTTQISSAVTASPASARVPRGKMIVVRARAYPAIKGQQFALQIKKGARWKNVAETRANGHGRTTLKAEPPKQAGWHTYRVVAVGESGIGSGSSAEMRIKSK